MKKIVLITGGFDPLHSGHIAYFKAAKALGDILIVGVNSDAWLTRKKGSPFMPYKERAEIVRNIVGVDFVIDFDSVWKWLGFTRKDNAKRLLDKFFVVNIDYMQKS